MKKSILTAAAALLMCSAQAVTVTADVNLDGEVTVADVTAIYDKILGNNVSATVAARSDVNNDGETTVADVTKVYNVILGVEAAEPEAEYLAGGDISLLTLYEQRGAKYYDTSGATITSPLAHFADKGWNVMRVRLFVDPANAPDDDKEEGVKQDLEYVKALGKRIKDAGFKFALDLHYSDTWADPGQQTLPNRWKGCTAAQLADSVYAYTSYVLQELKSAGATPDLVQTGNEVTYGMLWPTGHVYTSNSAPSGGSWTYFSSYLASAARAVREQCPKAKIIIHVEMARSDNPRNFFNTLESYNADYDVIGLSYYSAYHGNINTLNNVLNNLEADHPNKDIMIMEFAYGYAWALPGTKSDCDLSSTYPYSSTGQNAFTADVIAMLKNHSNVKGIFWWWPEANECGINWSTSHVTAAWWNGSLFDNSTGKAQPALQTLATFLDR